MARKMMFGALLLSSLIYSFICKPAPTSFARSNHAKQGTRVERVEPTKDAFGTPVPTGWRVEAGPQRMTLLEM